MIKPADQITLFSFPMAFANSASSPASAAPITTATTLAPINEAELAANLHSDPMQRDETSMRALLQLLEERDAAGAEEHRDLGGSFILPLLKERKYDNRSVPLLFPGRSGTEKLTGKRNESDKHGYHRRISKFTAKFI